MKALRCECGFVASGNDEELVFAAQHHAMAVHQVDLTGAEILSLAAVVPDDDARSDG